MKIMEESELPESHKSIDQNCIFCKIAEGEIPSRKIFDNKDFVAILDINPASEGHVLLFTKEHIQTLSQLNQEKTGLLGKAIKEISGMLIRSLDVKGISVFIANGYAAGQKAPHMIVHIIPRTKGDGVSLNPEVLDINPQEYNNYLNIMKSILGINSTNSSTNNSNNMSNNNLTNKSKSLIEGSIDTEIKSLKKENNKNPEKIVKIKKIKKKKTNKKPETPIKKTSKKEIPKKEKSTKINELDLVTRMFTE